MHIRKATIADLAAVVTCSDLAFAHVSGNRGVEVIALDCGLREQVLEGVVYVIGDGPRVVGYIALWPIFDHLFIDTIAVLPAHQWRGLGGRLLGFAEGEAARLGLASVRLFAKAAMADNTLFYERRGYDETGRCDEDGNPRVFYTKPVSPLLSISVS